MGLKTPQNTFRSCYHLSPCGFVAEEAQALKTIFFGTSNAGKQREIRRVMGSSGWDVRFPEGGELSLKVDETGSTFLDNARIKLEAYGSLRPELAVAAEDSGLVVPALGGEPGIYSARYGNLTRERQRNAYLLEKMSAFQGDERAAYYLAVVVLRFPGEKEFSFEGRVDGSIAVEPAGEDGFGYDPVFVDPVTGRTFAQLTPAEKDALSHRGIALRKMRNFLESRK